MRQRGMHPLACTVGLPNRLHIHTIADRSAIQAYIPGARRFLAFCVEFGAPVGRSEDKDRSLADCLSWLCYAEEEELQTGKNVFYGVLWAYPDVKPVAFQSRRALAGWERFALVGERTAVVWEVVLAMSQIMRQQGHIESADIVEACADLYWRMQDWFHLRDDDIISVGARGVAVLLGRGDRGETTKTGTNQAVRVDFSGVAAMLIRYRDAARRNGGGKVFRVQPTAFYAHWNQAARQLPQTDLDPGPPHCLRHTGPSFDMVEQTQGGPIPWLTQPTPQPGSRSRSSASSSSSKKQVLSDVSQADSQALKPYRSLQQVQDRGRWAHIKSCQRYSKSAFYLRALEKVGPEIRKLALVRRSALGSRPAVPRE